MVFSSLPAAAKPEEWRGIPSHRREGKRRDLSGVMGRSVGRWKQGLYGGRRTMPTTAEEGSSGMRLRRSCRTVAPGEVSSLLCLVQQLIPDAIYCPSVG